MDVLDPRHADPDARAELLVWLAVQRAFAFSPEKLPTAFRHSAEPARALREHGLEPLAAREGEQQLALLARAGVRALPITSPLYPPRIARLVDAPPLLFVRGTPELLLARAVAMVGARAATGYGLATAQTLAGDFARAGLVVVSGLARGVDAAAHRATLAAGGATLAFQACGPERVYPATHRRLADEVLASGALVSELPLHTPPRPPYFPMRNRLISALSEAVVVVEARIRSGSLTTARHAAEQGVEVFAVPGPVDRPTSAGPHLLIRDGAVLLSEASELLTALGLDAPAHETRARTDAPADALARKVLGALREEARDADALARALHIAPGALAGALASLEIDGFAAQDRDGRWTAHARAPQNT